VKWLAGLLHFIEASMVHLKNILLTTDLSPHSRNAIPYAVSLVGQYGGRLSLLHVEANVTPLMMPLPTGELVGFSGAGKLDRSREEHAALMALSEEIERDWKIQVEPLVRFGDAAAEIAACAREIGADCIVASSHGRTGLAHMVLGSTAERIVRLAPCAVLIVRPGAK